MLLAGSAHDLVTGPVGEHPDLAPSYLVGFSVTVFLLSPAFRGSHARRAFLRRDIQRCDVPAEMSPTR
jgi:hypothetical protein